MVMTHIGTLTPLTESRSRCCEMFISGVHLPTIHIIMSVRLLVGLYSQIGSSIAFTAIAKMYCTLFAIFSVYTILDFILLYENVFLIQTFHSLAMYILTVFVSLISDGEHFYKYLKEMDQVDPSTRTDTQNKLLIATFTFIITMASIIFQILFMYNTHKVLIIIVTVAIVKLGIYLSYVSRLLMFELLWQRLASLRRAIEDNLMRTHDDETHVELQIKRITDHLIIYTNILHTLNNFGHASKFMTLLSFPSLMFHICTFVLHIYKHTLPSVNSIYILNITLFISLPCIPAVVAELAKNEVDKIRNNFEKRLLNVPDGLLRDKIIDGIKFLELRPLKNTVWRIFALDISFLVSLFSICTTYTIVMVQFMQANNM